MIDIIRKNECCGCTACYNICPKNAINMKADKEGFLYPVVDKKICIDCSACEKVCPYLNEKRPERDLEETFVAINTNETLRAISSSGGMFVLFATVILKRGGIVYGAAFDKNWLVVHRGVDNEKELQKLIGSKYMQSYMGNIFSDVRENLKNNKEVLFVGTTCQINGLKNFLEKDYNNLFCIDFICLGVPSPMVWSDYLQTFFQDYVIESINFKEKSLGWHTFSLNINGKNKQFTRNGRQTYYYTGYFRHLYTRPSCSNCTYKLGNRCSDITISDCWGYHKIAPEMDDNKGMSSVVCHSQKGKKLFNQIKEQVKWKEADIADILEFNSGYRLSCDVSKQRSAFWNDYYKMNKKKLFKKYCSPEKKDIWSRVIKKTKRTIKHFIGEN